MICSHTHTQYAQTEGGRRNSIHHTNVQTRPQLGLFQVPTAEPWIKKFLYKVCYCSIDFPGHCLAFTLLHYSKAMPLCWRLVPLSMYKHTHTQTQEGCVSVEAEQRGKETRHPSKKKEGGQLIFIFTAPTDCSYYNDDESRHKHTDQLSHIQPTRRRRR